MPDARVIAFDGDDRGRLRSVPVSDGEEVFSSEEPDEADDGIRSQLVAALDFMRRRITGEYEVD